MLGRQISGKPIDYAILQMQFSEKRASRRIKSMLVLAKRHAISYKSLDPSKLIICELSSFSFSQTIPPPPVYISFLCFSPSPEIIYDDLSSDFPAESWVTKGPNSLKRLEPRGRAHFGIRVHPDSRMTVVLREGKTFDEKKNKAREKKLRAVRSAGVVREDVPLRNPAPMWGW